MVRRRKSRAPETEGAEFRVGLTAEGTRESAPSRTGLRGRHQGDYRSGQECIVINLFMCVSAHFHSSAETRACLCQEGVGSRWHWQLLRVLVLFR